jgi:apolipoprotein N-acyltransferase
MGLNNFLEQLLRRSRYVPAVLAGLVLATAFPRINLAGFAWIAPALILASAYGKSGADAFRIGYAAGLAFHLATLSWLLRIPAMGFPILGWLALSGVLALYTAVWVWLIAGKIGEGSWLRRTAWTLTGAAIWVALEMIRARLFSGFPWNNLGGSQLNLLPLVQIASITGVYGVSFMIAWASLALYGSVIAIFRHPNTRQVWLREIFLPLIVLIVLFGWGSARLRSAPRELDFARITMVQPSIPQTMIWSDTDSERRFAELLRITQDALTNDTDVLLWPEAAVPKMIRYDQATFDAIGSLAISNRVWLIVGSDDAEPGVNPQESVYYNSSFLISPEGGLMSRYNKRHLVMFGEYIPFARQLPFIKWFTPINAGFDFGDRVVPFELKLPRADDSANDSPAPRSIRTTTLICFEDTFPHLVRDYVTEDTDFLINLTNDGWFGEGAAQWQHAVTAAFRAIENGLPLVRCCNNGLTCWIDSHGRIREILRGPKGTIYEAGIVTSEIPILPPGEKRAPTFYNRHGDWFGWGCVAIMGIVLAPRLKRIFTRKSLPAAT